MADVDFGVLNEPNLPQGQADVLRILEGTLNSSNDPATAATKLADDLRQFFISSGSEDAASGLLWDLWMMLLDAVRIVPIDHPWHETLIAAVKELRLNGGSVAGLEDNSTLQWGDLPHLSMYLFDKWADPTDFDEYTPEDIETWKRFNSFASRLLSDDFTQWIVLPYWEIRATLETAPQEVSVFECKLWVATEWLARCGQLLYKDMASTDALTEREQASIAPGPLCKDIPPRSLERWNFWRSRLTELSRADPSAEDRVEQPPLSDESLSRITQAIGLMDEAQGSSQGRDLEGSGDTAESACRVEDHGIEDTKDEKIMETEK
ncbi:uncharacterized protein CTRU02_213962 [Colletotrichum truncatum]|uniref:Uncharacterized protein n=1 Tax=Colletotrichum truncatum TaxID=5467 RepID=A0ACC3YHB3_COLTU|nr:uncharacterized protein CTRU02_06275 [Colletotrichum truncatum]KAF6792779.1 hypothetical protein CTRU02_06275 [Colletotrichum truncatum]